MLHRRKERQGNEGISRKDDGRAADRIAGPTPLHIG